MTDPQDGPIPAEPPGIDMDDDLDDLVDGAEDLPEDVRDGDVATTGEPPDDGGIVPDTDVDAPVEGSPEDDVIQDEDEV
jgi:hypothetical protein